MRPWVPKSLFCTPFLKYAMTVCSALNIEPGPHTIHPASQGTFKNEKMQKEPRIMDLVEKILNLVQQCRSRQCLQTTECVQLPAFYSVSAMSLPSVAT